MLVYDVTNRDYMLHNCDEHPGKDKLRDTIDKLFIENNFLEDDLVTNKQWMKKEKYTNLVTLQLTVTDFIEEICCQYDELRAPHSISMNNNSQATLHPFVIYFKNDDAFHGLSYCVMSDILSHNAVVHAFITCYLV